MTMSACQVIMVALLDGYNNESTPFKILQNGHSSSVTCFLYPFAESNRYNPNLLLSGSADFSVIVWNVTTDERLHRFSSQGGTITQLLVPPVNSNVRFFNFVRKIFSAKFINSIIKNENCLKFKNLNTHKNCLLKNIFF
ncbi:unnamed protein product [Meloidogyne enterolobii]